MSQTAVPVTLPSCGRATQRWSVGGHPTESPASMAGLPASSACVWVGPPLFCNGPSFGSMALRSPAPPKLQLPSLSRLCPWEVMAPLQSPPVEAVLCATIVFFRATRPPPLFLTPPPKLAVVFPLRVLLSSLSVLALKRPPPPELLVFPLTVELSSVTVPRALVRPPP